MSKLNERSMRIGIDLGGTKIEMIALDNDGATVKQVRIPTPVGDYLGTINAISELVISTENELNLRAKVGVGMPGAISPATGKVKNSNSTCLNNRLFKQDLERALTRSIRVENDANCFALSEATDGAATNAKVVFGVILGTGVGGGLVINGHLISGPNAITGEWGHNPLPWPDQDEQDNALSCYCGKKGCIETWLCGGGLSRGLQTFSLTENTIPAFRIESLAEAGDKHAQKALELYCRRLAKGLSSVINIIDPDVIVLGGGVSNIKAIYSEVPKLWNDFVFSDRVDTKLVCARYSDASGVRGAAWL